MMFSRILCGGRPIVHGCLQNYFIVQSPINSDMGGMYSTQINMNSREANFVKNTVESNPVVMFSKTYCPSCQTAKSVLGELGVETKVFELDKMQDGPALQDVLGSMTSARTVPRVFIKGQCIGGCSELLSLKKTGELQQILQP